MAIEGIDGDQDPVTEPDFPIIGKPDDDGEVGIPVVEPSTITYSASESDGSPRRRGRPRGSKSPVAKQATKEVQQDLTGLLYSAHLMLAALTKVEELKLDKEEAKELGAAIARVNSEFGGVVVSPKTAACVNLAMVGGAVYGTRLIAYSNRMKQEAAAKRAGSQTQQFVN